MRRGSGRRLGRAKRSHPHPSPLPQGRGRKSGSQTSAEDGGTPDRVPRIGSGAGRGRFCLSPWRGEDRWDAGGDGVVGCARVIGCCWIPAEDAGMTGGRRAWEVGGGSTRASEGLRPGSPRTGWGGSPHGTSGTTCGSPRGCYARASACVHERGVGCWWQLRLGWVPGCAGQPGPQTRERQPGLPGGLSL